MADCTTHSVTVGIELALVTRVSRGSDIGRRFLTVIQAKNNTNVSIWTKRSHMAPVQALTCRNREDIDHRVYTSSYFLYL